MHSYLKFLFWSTVLSLWKHRSLSWGKGSAIFTCSGDLGRQEKKNIAAYWKIRGGSLKTRHWFLKLPLYLHILQTRGSFAPLCLERNICPSLSGKEYQNYRGGLLNNFFVIFSFCLSSDTWYLTVANWFWEQAYTFRQPLLFLANLNELSTI